VRDDEEIAAGRAAIGHDAPAATLPLPATTAARDEMIAVS
jgi:hypothetical protein